MTDSGTDLSGGLQLYSFSKAVGQYMFKSPLHSWQLEISAWLQAQP